MVRLPVPSGAIFARRVVYSLHEVAVHLLTVFVGRRVLPEKGAAC
jgi:hypothetical protein